MLYLHIHPCYIIKILKSDLLSYDEQKQLIKQLFRSKKKNGIERSNYLLVSIYEQMLEHDLENQIQKYNTQNKDSNEKQKSPLEIINLKDNLISTYIFRRIYKS
jgi:uncharacterized phage-like protein YoqJ